MTVSASHALSDSERSRLDATERLRARGSSSLEELLGMLDDPSWLVRRAVVEALASLGDAAVGPLCDLLRTRRDQEARLAAAVDALVASRGDVEAPVLRLTGDPNPAVVADAAQVLGRRRSESAIPVLLRLTQHENDNVAVAAIEALGRLGGRAAVEALIEAVGSGSFFRTFPAIDVLGRSGDPRAVEPLARLLANPNYLPEAARALGRAGERAGVTPLLGLLKSGTDAVVRVAARALWELRERYQEKAGGDARAIDELLRANVGPETVRRLSRGMASADASEAVAVCRLLGAAGSAEAGPVLAAQLDGPPPVAACAAEALRSIGRDADAHLSRALRAGASASRKVLLPVVVRASVAPDVARCLDDADPEVRALACDTLARLGSTGALPELFRLLEDPNLRVVHAATAAIQALGTREATALAAAAAKSESPVARRSALQIFAYFGDRSALAPLLGALEDSDDRVRDAALQGLPYLEDGRALEALFEASESPAARTRAIATRSLGHVVMAGPRVYSQLQQALSDPDAWVRYYACQSLGRLSYAPAAPRVAALLADEAGQVQVAAVEALSHMESPEAHRALREAAASTNIDVQRAALVGLGIAHREEDLPIVLSAASAPDAPTRLMALSALVRFSSPSVLGGLRAAASDPDEQVRSAAIGFLAERREREGTDALVQLLAPEVTRERAKAALLVPSEGRIAGLLEALQSANDELAAVLVSILARNQRPEARAALLSASTLDNVAARKAAVTALAAHRDPQALAALRDAADNDPDPEVRQICALLLSE